MQVTRSLTLMLIATLGISVAQTATAASQEYPPVQRSTPWAGFSPTP